jgi:isopentenyl-diphosphate delta-isomerase
MQRSDEVLDVVNDCDEVIAQAARREVHARGLKHRAVHVLVFNRRGDLFLQRRAAAKDTFPGRYDSSASGHVESGEEYDDCAVRESREELGLEIERNQLNKLFKINACRETGCEFVWVYAVRGDFQPRVNPAEIDEGAFWDVAAIQQLVADHPQRCAPSFCRVIRECATRGLLPAAGAAGQ